MAIHPSTTIFGGQGTSLSDQRVYIPTEHPTERFGVFWNSAQPCDDGNGSAALEMYSGNDTTRDVLAKLFKPNYTFAVSESDVALAQQLQHQPRVIGYPEGRRLLVVSYFAVAEVRKSARFHHHKHYRVFLILEGTSYLQPSPKIMFFNFL